MIFLPVAARVALRTMTTKMFLLLLELLHYVPRWTDPDEQLCGEVLMQLTRGVVDPRPWLYIIALKTKIDNLQKKRGERARLAGQPGSGV